MTTKDEALQQALEAMNLARSAHGQMLMSDPPQEAWKARGVSDALTKAMTATQSALAEQPAQQYPLPDDLYDSKDWREGSYSERVAWLHTMYEGAKKSLDDYMGQPAQQQEPVAEVESDGVLRFKKIDRRYQVGDKLYLSPPQRKPWVSLTDEEENEYNHLGPDMRWVIQEVEAKLKEKNA